MFTCDICKRVKSLSLTRALFKFWVYREHLANPICVCHNCNKWLENSRYNVPA